MKKQYSLTWIKRLANGVQKRSEDGPWFEDVDNLKGCVLRYGSNVFEFKMIGSYILRERKLMNSKGPDTLIGWTLSYKIPEDRIFTQVGVCHTPGGVIVFPIEPNGFVGKIVSRTYNIESYDLVTCNLNIDGQIQLSFA